MLLCGRLIQQIIHNVYKYRVLYSTIKTDVASMFFLTTQVTFIGLTRNTLYADELPVISCI